jgi:hypothetical protein
MPNRNGRGNESRFAVRPDSPFARFAVRPVCTVWVCVSGVWGLVASSTTPVNKKGTSMTAGAFGFAFDFARQRLLTEAVKGRMRSDVQVPVADCG